MWHPRQRRSAHRQHVQCGPRKSSTENSGTEAVDAGQKKLLPMVLLVTALAAIMIERASFAILAILIVVGAIYLLVVVWGARIVRTVGLKLWYRGRGD